MVLVFLYLYFNSIKVRLKHELPELDFDLKDSISIP